MPLQFYKPTVQCPTPVQGVLRVHKRVQLTKEARAAVNARQREASRRYRKDIEDAWAKIDEATENIASTHHKSIRHVQSEFHMGSTMSRSKREKSSPWNAFFWKKGIALKEYQAQKAQTNGGNQFFTFIMIFY
jgi:hypothetical protein